MKVRHTMTKRTSGVLMHITSLPGEFGIGSFGQSAYDFVDFLKETKQTYWQLLPLTTTSYGDSPYQSFSAIAGNTHLIDLDLLEKDGLLHKNDYKTANFGSNPESVDYGLLFDVRRPILEKAVQNFIKNGNQDDLAAFENEQSEWLNDYADFMAIKESFNNQSLLVWEDEAIRQRDPEALAVYREKLANVITYHKVTQYFFFKQWNALKSYANQEGIKIIGDMPIYISADSVEMWTHPELFKVDVKGQPKYVAGVPADEFSADGQYWGNPIYDWEKHAETGYAWWIYRIRESFKLYDVLRIDHFKGFSDFWQVDASESTAVNGSWQSGPGYDLFKAVKAELGDLPIIAENLGYIDEKAEELLTATAFPGMKILEFGFFDTTSESRDLPHNYTADTVAYTGTHDNEVVNGWYENLTDEQREFADRYMKRLPDEPITQAMLRTLYASVADTAISCMQDILDLKADSRMNLPNTVGRNWKWRMKADDLTQDKKDYLKNITLLYQRGNK